MTGLLDVLEPNEGSALLAQTSVVAGTVHVMQQHDDAQAAADGTVQTPATAFSNASGTMIVNEVAGSPILARMAAADTIVIARNASESSDYLAALRAGAPEDDRG